TITNAVMLTHITIIIAHSQPLLRLFLQNIFSSRPGIFVAAIVADAQSLHKAVTRHQPDVIVADISLPGIRQLPQRAASTRPGKPAKIIFFWQYCHEPLVRKMIHNAAGFIMEDAILPAYYTAIKEVMKGNAYYCPQTERLAGFLNNNNAAIHAYIEKLNKKYLMLLLCTMADFTVQETAAVTNLTDNTVKTYRQRFKKMIGSDS